MTAKSLFAIASIAAFTVGAQTHAMAQVVISGDYYEQRYSHGCANAPACRMNLLPIPSNKILDIEHVYCTIETDMPLTRLYMGATATSGGSPQRVITFPFSTQNYSSGYYRISVNMPVKYRIGASPYIFFQSSLEGPGYASLTCTVVGTTSPR